MHKNFKQLLNKVDAVYDLHMTELESIRDELSNNIGPEAGRDQIPNWKLKSFVLLAYGHFEGSVKEIADICIEHVNDSVTETNVLTPYLFLKINHGRISDMANTVSVTSKLRKVTDINNSSKSVPIDLKKYVETRSNLNSDNYEEICALFNFIPYTDSAQSSVLSDFVNETRHPIAHSGFLRSKKEVTTSEASSQIDVVIKLLIHFKTKILDSIKNEKYIHTRRLVFLST